MDHHQLSALYEASVNERQKLRTGLFDAANSFATELEQKIAFPSNFQPSVVVIKEFPLDGEDSYGVFHANLPLRKGVLYATVGITFTEDPLLVPLNLCQGIAVRAHNGTINYSLLEYVQGKPVCATWYKTRYEAIDAYLAVLVAYLKADLSIGEQENSPVFIR